MLKIFKSRTFRNSLIILSLFILLLLSVIMNLTTISSVFSNSETVCVPIIMYHQVKENNFGKDVISPYEFESDLIYLSENNYSTITIQQLVDYVYEKTELPPNPIIITFDDGYLNTYKYVFPLLQKYNMKIVLSIIGRDTDNYSAVSDTNINYAYMTWEQLKEMSDSGLAEIQNHTYDLHSVNKGRVGCTQIASESTEEYAKVLKEDVGKFQEKITSMIGATPTAFTYPYGVIGENTDLILKDLGFKATLSCNYGVNVISGNPDELFGLKRICRSHNQHVKKMISEGMETLKYSQKR